MYETLGSQLYLVLAINKKIFWIFESWTVSSFSYCCFLYIDGVTPDLKIPLAMSHPARGKSWCCLSPSRWFLCSLASIRFKSLLEAQLFVGIFREKRDMLFGGRIRPEFLLKVKVRLYDNFISQLKCEMTGCKEKERILSGKWHLSTKKSLDLLRKVQGLRISLQKMTDELDSMRGEIRQLQQTIQIWQNVVDFLRSR